MEVSFQHSRISSIIGVSAKEQYSLEAVCSEFADQHMIDRLKKNIGFEYLRLTDKNKCITDLAFEGILKLQSLGAVEISEVDALVFVSETPDYQVPFPSYMLQKKLGFKHDCFMLDAVKGCSGFVDGLFMAATLLEQKKYKKILVCAGDVNVRPTAQTEQRLNMSIFADGVGIAVLDYCSEPCKSFFEIHSDGQDYSAVIFENMPGSAYRFKRGQPIVHHGMFIDGPVLASYILDKCVDYQKKLLDFAHTDLSAINKIICHQANKILVKSFAMRLGLTLEKVPFVAQNTGNTGAATIPMALSEYFAEQNNGLCSLSGFGAGLAFCGMITDLSQTQIYPALYI